MIVGAALGIVVVSALWWLYFDVAAIFARSGSCRRTLQAVAARAALLQHLHLPMIAGIVLFALGLKTTLGLVSAVCSLVVAYEVIRYRAARIHVRHPELAA